MRRRGSIKVMGEFILNHCISLPPQQRTTWNVSGNPALSTLDYLINENEKTSPDGGGRAKLGVYLIAKINSE